LETDTYSSAKRFSGSPPGPKLLEHDGGIATLQLKPLQQMASQGLGVIVVRHERKMGGEVGDSGAGQLGLRGRRGHPGFAAPGGRRRISWRPGAALDLASRNFLRRTDQMRRIDARIGAVLPGSEEQAIAEPRIAQLTGLSRTTVQRALERLIAQGRAIRTGKGRSRQPFLYWAKPG
jgi:biotin operon repressor